MRSVRLLVALLLAFYDAAATLADTAGRSCSLRARPMRCARTHRPPSRRLLGRVRRPAPHRRRQLPPGALHRLGRDVAAPAHRFRDRRVTPTSNGRAASSRAFFKPARRRVRSMTGLIGHRDRRHYHLRTTMNSIRHPRDALQRADLQPGLQAGRRQPRRGRRLRRCDRGRIAVSPMAASSWSASSARRVFPRGEPGLDPSASSRRPRSSGTRREPRQQRGGRTFAGIPGSPRPPRRSPTLRVRSERRGVAAAHRRIAHALPDHPRRS